MKDLQGRGREGRRRAPDRQMLAPATSRNGARRVPCSSVASDGSSVNFATRKPLSDGLPGGVRSASRRQGAHYHDARSFTERWPPLRTAADGCCRVPPDCAGRLSGYIATASGSTRSAEAPLPAQLLGSRSAALSKCSRSPIRLAAASLTADARSWAYWRTVFCAAFASAVTVLRQWLGRRAVSRLAAAWEFGCRSRVAVRCGR